MDSLKFEGLTLLSEEEINETDGGVLGTAIAIGIGAYRIYKIPGVAPVVNNTVKAVAKLGAGYLGYKTTTGW